MCMQADAHRIVQVCMAHAHGTTCKHGCAMELGPLRLPPRDGALWEAMGMGQEPGAAPWLGPVRQGPSLALLLLTPDSLQRAHSWESLLLNFSSGSTVGCHMSWSPALCLSFLICKMERQSHTAMSKNPPGFVFPSLPLPQSPL